MNKRLRELDDELNKIGVELQFRLIDAVKIKEVEDIIKKHACMWVAKDYQAMSDRENSRSMGGS